MKSSFGAILTKFAKFKTILEFLFIFVRAIDDRVTHGTFKLDEIFL